MNLKSIVSCDVTIKVFGDQVLQGKLDCVRLCLKSTDNKNIEINCLVKEICQALHGQDILHANQKFKHLKNVKLADSNSNNENFCVDILIGSNFLWDVFENEIIQGEPDTSIAMKTKFSYVWLYSTLICHSLKCATEISKSDSIFQRKLENFWDIKRFDYKTDNSTVYRNFCEDIRYNSIEYRYEFRLPFKEDHEILPDNFTYCKHRLSNSTKN